MASEELQQKYPNNEGKKIGRYEVFEAQLVTLQQFGEHGIIPNKDYGTYKTQKCDTLIITRVPYARAVAVGEHKKPGGVTQKNWKTTAKDLLLTKCHPVDALLGYVTDGTNTYWINGRAPDVLEVVREDGNAMPGKINFNDAAFVSDLNYILNNFDPITNLVKDKTRTSPDALAGEIWQTVWRLHADRPEDCLATFVELFVYKFLDDLGLMKINSQGVSVDLKSLMDRPRDKSLIYYESHVRPYIKELFPSGQDGYSIINGTVLQSNNLDHNLIFHEIMKKLDSCDFRM